MKIKTIQWLDMGIFPGTVMFCSGFKYHEIIKHLKKCKASAWICGLQNEATLFSKTNRMALRRDIENKRTGSEKVMFYIIFQDQFTFSDHDMCVLAHEVLHIVQFFLPDILDRNKEREAEAYLHTHLMEQCLKHLRGKKISVEGVA